MKKYFKSLIKHPLTIKFLARVIAGYISIIFKTIKWQKIGWQYPEQYWRENKPFITCFWHNRLLMTCFCWQGQNTFHMLISAHADGQLIAQTVAHHGIKTIAGSKSKQGAGAVRAILKILKQGNTIGITPDGPRGPRFKASEGIVSIARLSKLDILPVTFATQYRWVIKSWDRFIFALPFGCGVMAWGQPICYQDLNVTDKDIILNTITDGLQQICDHADMLCGHLPLR